MVSEFEAYRAITASLPAPLPSDFQSNSTLFHVKNSPLAGENNENCLLASVRALDSEGEDFNGLLLRLLIERVFR